METYYGVFYGRRDDGYWYCELIDKYFATKAECKFYIKDWYWNK